MLRFTSEVLLGWLWARYSRASLPDTGISHTYRHSTTITEGAIRKQVYDVGYSNANGVTRNTVSGVTSMCERQRAEDVCASLARTYTSRRYIAGFTDHVIQLYVKPIALQHATSNVVAASRFGVRTRFWRRGVVMNERCAIRGSVRLSLS